MTRTDEHRPSVINPEEYDFVAHWMLKIEDFGSAAVILAEREALKNHMEQTGGNWAGHAHGGNCMVCGSVNAVWTNVFYHERSNSYVRVGADCSEKLWNSDFGMNSFRAVGENVREAQAGKRKAQALLADRGLELAWAVATDETPEGRDARNQYEERTITDIVGKLIQYGSLSDKQFSFLAGLVDRIANRAAIQAERAAEAAQAADAPAGRLTVTGQVLSIKLKDGYYGSQLKMVVKTTDGWKAYGTCPAALEATERGETVTFTATFEPANDDPKFAFFKRPTAA